MSAPMHPYTRALVDSIPGAEAPPGITQNDVDDDAGCVFARRCPRVQDDCLAGVSPRGRSARGRSRVCTRSTPNPHP